jgi:3-methylcrotonyl-CoA carboxylase alpha subunit
MRRVESEEDFADALDAARREARAAFGDDGVLLERCLLQPRHIEVQIFGDRHGNVVHLFERDCSLQRRHQKVIEEAPAPGMTAEMRRGDGGRRHARCPHHRLSRRRHRRVHCRCLERAPAGPLLFHGNEHAAAGRAPHHRDAITGVDLVEWQLRIAAGEPLPKKQSELEIDGWAFEARVYAEDVAKAFMPAAGTIAQMHFPGDGVRIDAGVRSGDTISTHYDPLIAKLTVHGPNRAAALSRLTKALRASDITGLTTNLDFLARLSVQDEFVAGHPDTGLIDRNIDRLTAFAPPADTAIAIAAVLSLGALDRHRGSNPWETLGHWQLWSDMQRIVTLEHDGGSASLRIAARGFDFFAVHDGRRVIPVKIVSRVEGGCRAEVDGRQAEVTANLMPDRLMLRVDSRTYLFHLPDPLNVATEETSAGSRLMAPMPGFVKIVRTQAGDTVLRNAPLVVMEAMKMELTLVAPRDGVIEAIEVTEGQQVDEGALLVILKPVEA